MREKPVLPRQRRPPKRYELNSRVSNFTTCEEFYHQQYIEALHIVVNMLRVRFTQRHFKLLCDAEKGRGHIRPQISPLTFLKIFVIEMIYSGRSQHSELSYAIFNTFLIYWS